ncbi:MAG: ABC transporter permease [Bacteroidales bacterium]|nr:ABC transporter permease [Bacteroidales bacterium]
MRGFIIKEFYHIFRDVRSMLILFGMPVVQVLIFGFAISTEIRNAPVAILDHSNDYVTQQITNKLLSSGFFVRGDQIENENQIQQIFRKGKVKEIIVFEKDFAKNLENEKEAHVQLIADASDPNVANLIVNYTNAIIQSYQQEYFKGMALPVEIVTESQMLYNPGLKSVFMFIPGIITILLMLISAMMTSISIAREKEMGTMEILLVSPLNPIQIVAGKVIPYVLISFINALTILLMSFFIFKMPLEGNMVLLLLESILFIVMALSLGIFISTVSNSQQMAMMLSMFALMLPTILLSGFIFPIENMPYLLQLLSNIMPPRWFIIIIKSIMLKGLGIQYVWKETLIIAGMAVFFIALSIRKFKIRLE